MSIYIEGREYTLKTPTGSFVVACNKVFDTGSVSFFRYKKQGAKTPIARYKMNKEGVIKEFPEFSLTLVEGTKKVAVKTNSKSTKTPLEGSKLESMITDAWKRKAKSGYYRAIANFNRTDEFYDDVLFLSKLCNTIEQLDNS